MVINSAVDDRDFDKRSKKVHHRKLFWYDFLKTSLLWEYSTGIKHLWQIFTS
jgi:hypothetical protein